MNYDESSKPTNSVVRLKVDERRWVAPIGYTRNLADSIIFKARLHPSAQILVNREDLGKSINFHKV